MALKAEKNLTIVNLPLSDIEVPEAWNCRSQTEGDTTTETGEGSRGWIGNLFSIARDGLRDPVTVRPNPRTGKGVPKYSLVTGFGRVKAVKAIASGSHRKELTDPKGGGLTVAQAEALLTSKPSIKAVVKELNETQAQAENAGENVQRDSLSGPDVAFAVIRLRRTDPTLTDDQIAVMFNKNQPYVSKLLRIAEGCGKVTVKLNRKDKPLSILDAWRKDAIKLTQNDMDAIARAPEEKRADLYLEKRGVKQAKAKGEIIAPTRGAGAAIKNLIKIDAPHMATTLLAM